MEVTENIGQRSHNVGDFLLGHFVADDVIEQLSSLAQFLDHVHLLIIFVDGIKSDDVGMTAVPQKDIHLLAGISFVFADDLQTMK